LTQDTTSKSSIYGLDDGISIPKSRERL
jgi:hypothetical protein